MNLIISNSSGKPIYEQITAQIKNSILSGELQEGEALPSMRALAKDLRISVITTKRAYEDLERDGFVVTVAGKGCFVAPRNLELMREEQRKRIEQTLEQAVEQAQAASITLEEMQQMLSLLYEEGLKPERRIGLWYCRYKICVRNIRSFRCGTSASSCRKVPSWA